MREYSERLKMYRKHAGLTQKQLAQIIGVDHSIVSNWERDVSKIDVDMLIPISNALNISVNDLLGFYTDFSLNSEEEELIKIYREISKPGNEVILELARAFLSYKKDNLEKEKNEKFITRPLYDLPASAGTGQFLDSDQFEMMEFPSEFVPKNSTFAVRVAGDSMEPEFADQSIVFVEQRKKLNHGDIGVFILNNEAYLKICGENELLSFNSDYSPIPINEYDDLRVVGKVVGKYEK